MTTSGTRPPASGRRSRRTVIWLIVAVLAVCAAIAIAVVVVTGQRGATPPTTPSAIETPSPSPSVSPSASPTPSPTPSAADPADPSTWVVTQEGMGPFRLGASFADASALVPNGQSACTGVTYGFDNALWVAEGNNTPGTVQMVLWDGGQGGPGPVTAEGIGIGSSADEVRAAYPDATEEGMYLRTGAVYFDVETGAVRAIGVTPGEIPSEFCG